MNSAAYRLYNARTSFCSPDSVILSGLMSPLQKSIIYSPRRLIEIDNRQAGEEMVAASTTKLCPSARAWTWDVGNKPRAATLRGW